MPIDSEPGRSSRNDSKDIVVFMVRRETKCDECAKELFDGSMLRMEADRALYALIALIWGTWNSSAQATQR